jgi:hypothetical protein
LRIFIFFAHFVENKSLPLRLKQGVLPLQCIAAAAPFAAERPVRGWFRDFELFYMLSVHLCYESFLRCCAPFDLIG